MTATRSPWPTPRAASQCAKREDASAICAEGDGLVASVGMGDAHREPAASVRVPVDALVRDVQRCPVAVEELPQASPREVRLREGVVRAVGQPLHGHSAPNLSRWRDDADDVCLLSIDNIVVYIQQRIANCDEAIQGTAALGLLRDAKKDLREGRHPLSWPGLGPAIHEFELARRRQVEPHSLRGGKSPGHDGPNGFALSGYASLLGRFFQGELAAGRCGTRTAMTVRVAALLARGPTQPASSRRESSSARSRSSSPSVASPKRSSCWLTPSMMSVCETRPRGITGAAMTVTPVM